MHYKQACKQKSTLNKDKFSLDKALRYLGSVLKWSLDLLNDLLVSLKSSLNLLKDLFEFS